MKYKDAINFGANVAAKRYGSPHETIPNPPASEQAPQDPIDKHGPKYDNDTPSNWLRGMGAGEAEGKPSFDKGSK